MEKKLIDADCMPIGMHSGKMMCQVPANYLLDLEMNTSIPMGVRLYIEENKVMLEYESRSAKKKDDNSKAT